MTLPRHWPPTPEDDIEMMRTPAEWPHAGRLALKRRVAGESWPELGFLLRHDVEGGFDGIRVFVGTIFEDPSRLPRREYMNAEAASADGWIVD